MSDVATAEVQTKNGFTMTKVGTELPGRTFGGQRASKLQEILKFVDSANGDWCEVAEYNVPQSAATAASTWGKKTDRHEFAMRTVVSNGAKVGKVYCRTIKEGEVKSEENGVAHTTESPFQEGEANGGGKKGGKKAKTA